MNKLNQFGITQIFILFLTVGLLAFIFITNSFDFKDKLFSKLFPKSPSKAAGETNWQIFNNNPIIFPSGGSEGDNIYAPEVHKEGNNWKMWYGGQGDDGHDRIHYATSTDGINWQKMGVVLDNGSANHVNDPSIINVSGIYYMYYTEAPIGIDDQINLATSSDGINWQKKGAVLTKGAPGEWDQCMTSRPSVIYENGVFKIWYDGRSNLPSGSLPVSGCPEVPPTSISERSVGYATSSDGINWQKYAGNPIFNQDAGAVDVKKVNNRYVMLYENINGTYWADGSSETNFTLQGLMLAKSGGSEDQFGHITPMIFLENSIWNKIYFAGASDSCWCKNRIFLAINPLATPTPTPTPSPSPSPTPPPRVGDINGDGSVNVVDFSIMLSKWGTADVAADLNGDGIVNVVDFSILLSNWGT